jgi:hypothetical protein
LPAPAGVEEPALPDAGPDSEIELERPAAVPDIGSDEPAVHSLSEIDGAGVLRLSVAGVSPGRGAAGGLAPLSRARRGRSWMGRLIGVVGGAVVGLAMGYIALLWIGGPSRDFLQFGSRLPPFLVPADFRSVVADAGKVPGGRSPNGSARHAPLDPGQNARRPSGAEWSVTEPKTIDDHNRVQPPRGTGVARPAAPAPEPARPPAATERTHVGAERTRVGTEPPAQPRLPVRNPPAFPVAELDRALAAAQAVGDHLVDGSLADVTTRPAMGSAYRALCHLAETLTFPEPDADPAHVQRCRTAAADLVLGVARIEEKRRDLGRIADHWIDSSKRSGNGVVLAGPVQTEHTGGSLSALRMTLAGRRTMTVLTRGQAPIGPNEQVIVLGSIVEDPAANVVDYRGTEKRIVWAALIRPVVPAVKAGGQSE